MHPTASPNLSARNPSIDLESRDSSWTLRLSGEVGLESCARLKEMVLEALLSEKKPVFDLTDVSLTDVTLLQLIVATELESPGNEGKLVRQISDQARETARSAGFVDFPGSFIKDERN